MSLVTALAMAGSIILALNILIVAPWQILLVILAIVWFKTEAALEQCRRPVEKSNNDLRPILTYRGADYQPETQTQVFNDEILPELSYRGAHYKPDMSNLSKS
jgi:hypothetical protein